MSFPQSDSERFSLRSRARQAVESHSNINIHSPDPETRKMREREHTGIELTAVELAYLKNAVFDRVRILETKISELGRSLSERTEPNPANTEEELQKMRKELHFLQHNLGEKLFAE